MNGKLIVLEGLDGSGKTTQFEKIDKLLYAKSIDHKAISFPDYDQPSSELVRMYLAGEILQDPKAVNAFAASSFYAVDRYVSFKKFWEEDYNNGKLIFAARYVTSNMIYQMVKLPEEEWRSYIEWLSDYEYDKLGLPEPDLVIFMDMPVDISQQLLSKRYTGTDRKKDIHEANVSFLHDCRKAAFFAAKELGWKIVSCAEDGRARRVDSITTQLLDIIDNALVEEVL